MDVEQNVEAEDILPTATGGLFSLKAPNFTVDRHTEAEAFINEQRNLWLGLTEEFRRRRDGSLSALDRRRDGSLSVLDHRADLEKLGNLALRSTQNILNEIDQIVKLGREIRERNGFLLLPVILPILDENSIGLARTQFRTSAEFAAALMLECPTLSQITSYPVNTELLGEILRQLHPNRLLQEVRTTSNQHNREISELVAQTRSTIEQAKKDIENTRSDFENTLETRKRELEAEHSEAKEKLRHTASSDLWYQKITTHNKSFVGWLIAFFAIALTAAAFIYWNLSNITAAIPKDKDGVITYHSLVFFLVPVLAVAWILRLISKFIVSSLQQLDDARHRDAMIKTYLSLVGDKDSKVDEKDRLVMLSAIFRPLPGTQAEDIAPPSILDIIKQK